MEIQPGCRGGHLENLFLTCDQSMSVIVLIVTPPVPSTIALKAYSSYILAYCRNLVGNISVTCISKIAKVLLIGNPGWLPWLPT